MGSRKTSQGAADPVNPYQHAMAVIGGKWKLTIIHEIAYFGEIRFNRSRRALKMSEKVFSEQMAGLVEDGIVERRVDASCTPPAVFYTLTPSGSELASLIDGIFQWSIGDMKRKGIPLDPDAYVVHSSERYLKWLEQEGYAAPCSCPCMRRKGAQRGDAKGCVRAKDYYGHDPRLE
ncbi:MAG: winged helix-turn-helix transcriptional regulator [Atopobiaceae bacterium]